MLQQTVDTLKNNKEQAAILMRSYREQAAANGIPQETPQLPHVSEADRLMRRRGMRLLRAYSAHLFSNMAEGMHTFAGSFLLLDPDGCVVQIRATDECSKELAELGIGLGTVWRTDVTGADAICVGNAERCAMQSCSDENYLDILKSYALYFAPLRVMEKGFIRNMGGTALICPKEEKSEAFMLLALSIASALNIRISTSWNTCDSYEGNAEGIAQLDINTVSEEVAVTHHNMKFWDMLGVPAQDRWTSYFKPISEFIDPLPDNQRFWEIIREQQEVKDQDITIKVGGRKLNRVISTTSTTHPELKSKGVLLSITTRKDISHQVADKTGNNAVVTFSDIVGSSIVMKNRINRAKLLASTESNIMLLGESGVGKDVFAQAIHNQSHRRNGPFVTVNCGALPRDLIASELFGYDGGAFTGAKKQGNIGKFELAEGGTLFLDEIGEMPLDLQATLLRAVEQKQFMRLGSSKTIKADVRIISATNVDINKMIRDKRFRSDLYYRLSTMSMDIPPLRERGEDVILLAESFIRRISRKIGRQDIMEITPQAKEFLRSCPWQGNVRELQNLMDCMVQLYSGHLITPGMIRENINPSYYEDRSGAAHTGYGRSGESDLIFGVEGEHSPNEHRGDRLQRGGEEAPDRMSPAGEDRRDLPLLTKEEILEALEICEGNRSKAAKYLNVGRRTLYRYISRLGIGDKKYNK